MRGEPRAIVCLAENAEVSRKRKASEIEVSEDEACALGHAYEGKGEYESALSSYLSGSSFEVYLEGLRILKKCPELSSPDVQEKLNNIYTKWESTVREVVDFLSLLPS